jgi:hypothetical protein
MADEIVEIKPGLENQRILDWPFFHCNGRARRKWCVDDQSDDSDDRSDCFRREFGGLYCRAQSR